jgi:hypothetical protein
MHKNVLTECGFFLKIDTLKTEIADGSKGIYVNLFGRLKSDVGEISYIR